MEDTEFTTVRNSRKKQTCKYCKKQGHSISNCWTLKSKINARGKNQKQLNTNKQTEPNNKILNESKNRDNIYICPITTSKN